MADELIITPHKISVLTMNQVKHMEGSGWIAWDPKQKMVYAISRRTMFEDYEQLEEEVIS